jgi:16S rRNA (guanine527-N7)-methyltransferase
MIINELDNQVALRKEWDSFFTHEKLSTVQQEQFKAYFKLLQEWNLKFNITAITDSAAIIADHFFDSVQLRHAIDLTTMRGIADVGSGGGFPGIPLKICYPGIPVTLIEVNQKKIEFLETVIQELGLQGIETCSLDWRTFLRTTHKEIDLFIARASLQPEELLRLFQSSSPYKTSTLVYWASQLWKPTSKIEHYMQRTVPYSVGNKRRVLVFFKKEEDSKQ